MNERNIGIFDRARRVRNPALFFAVILSGCTVTLNENDSSDTNTPVIDAAPAQEPPTTDIEASTEPGVEPAPEVSAVPIQELNYEVEYPVTTEIFGDKVISKALTYNSEGGGFVYYSEHVDGAEEDDVIMDYYVTCEGLTLRFYNNLILNHEGIDADPKKYWICDDEHLSEGEALDLANR